MLGFFKRKRLHEREKVLLSKTLKILPKEYHNLTNQVEEGLIKGIRIPNTHIIGYVDFLCNSEVLNKYDNPTERDYKITNIEVFDKLTSSYLNYSIYVITGTINGYSIESKQKYNIDIDKTNVTKFKKIYLDSYDYDRVSSILNPDEKILINSSEIYLVEFDSNKLYHIKDLEDGDFIAIDLEKKVYKITHDPMEIVSMTVGLEDILKHN